VGITYYGNLHGITPVSELIYMDVVIYDGRSGENPFELEDNEEQNEGGE
jgi:hypothetical protein